MCVHGSFVVSEGRFPFRSLPRVGAVGSICSACVSVWLCTKNSNTLDSLTSLEMGTVSIPTLEMGTLRLGDYKLPMVTH